MDYNKKDEFKTDFIETNNQMSSKQDEIQSVCSEIRDISKTMNGDVFYPEDECDTKLWMIQFSFNDSCEC